MYLGDESGWSDIFNKVLEFRCVLSWISGRLIYCDLFEMIFIEIILLFG